MYWWVEVKLCSLLSFGTRQNSMISFMSCMFSPVTKAPSTYWTSAKVDIKHSVDMLLQRNMLSAQYSNPSNLQPCLCAEWVTVAPKCLAILTKKVVTCWNLPWAVLKYQDATGLAAGTGRLTMGVEIVPSPNEADTCTELFGLRIVLDIREIGPYLLTIGGSNGMNSSSAMTESDLHKVQSNY